MVIPCHQVELLFPELKPTDAGSQTNSCQHLIQSVLFRGFLSRAGAARPSQAEMSLQILDIGTGRYQ